MLDATRLLLTDDVPFALQSLAARAVIDAGGPDDLAALLDRMLAAPTDPIGRALMARGDRDTGDRLLRAFVRDDRLIDRAPEVVLHALGYLGVVEAEPALWHAARTGDHAAHRSACFGLVHLPCAGREPAIADAIRDCHGRALFHEFTPMLAVKVGDPGLLAPFVAPGAPTSTDCLGGVLLGLALLGARARFEAVLFDPHWEATDTGTGNLGCTWPAVRVLGLSLIDLIRAHRRALTDHALAVLAALARVRATHGGFVGLRAALPAPDDDLDLHRELFDRPDSLLDLAHTRRDPARRACADLGEARVALAERIARRLATLR